MVDRADEREQTPCFRGLAHASQCQNGPCRTMRILTAVLANAGRIALDVTRLLYRLVKRRCEQTQQFALIVEQIFLERSHCLLGTLWISNARQHAP
ncbi:hypothetical protein D9M72_626460 [compost metagenome]